MSLYNTYTNYLKEVVESNLELPFKINPNFTYMLEHVNYDQGKQYLNLIKKEFQIIYETNKQLIVSLINNNDSIGNPAQYYFDDFKCSPSNLRYIYQTMLILKYLKTNYNNDIDILEIGGGYGGLGYFMFNLSNLFDIKLSSYTIMDLETPSKLQKKYTEKLMQFV